MVANKFKADNLAAIVDNNGVQLDGTVEEIMPKVDLAVKFSLFGWKVLACDGHDAAAVADALDRAKVVEDSPCAILARNVKGKNIWHGKSIDEAEYARAMAKLKGVNA